MLPVYGPYSMGDISSGSELLLHLFPLFRVSRAMQIFSKDSLADQGGEYKDGGSVNQPVTLQGGVPQLLRAS